ncbi:MAG: hypothetical protein IKT79_05485, partial [Akkermansia sp.]|nr:hypothetical protein [Akkermansia sp.]
DVVLRSANAVPDDYVYEAAVVGKTNVTGRLIFNPFGNREGYEFTKAANLRLGSATEYADISSFEQIVVTGNEHTVIYVDGELRAEEGRGHFNKLTVDTARLQVNLGDETYHFAGTTSLATTEPNNWNKVAQISFYRNSSNANVVVNLDELVDAVELTDEYIGNWNTHYIGVGGAFDYDANSTMTLNIASVNTKAYFDLNNTRTNVVANFNIEKGNKFWQKQYSGSTSQSRVGTVSLTLTGEGTYVLTEGNSIRDNFGIVSTEVDEETGKHKWRGIVEVTNLNATAVWNSGTTKNGIDLRLYGNAESYVHFTGFKGYFYASDGYDNMTSDVNLILSNSASETTPNAFEISNGFSNQTLRFNGSIQGDGDFVISADPNQSFTFAGELSEWKNGGELIVKNGTTSVTFTDKATVINPDVKTTAGTMNATISNDKAVTVGGTFSHAEGGNLNLTVDTAAGTTFTKSIDVTSFATTESGKAVFNESSTAGNVTISSTSRGGNTAPATVSNGMVISGNSIAGGHAETATLSFTTNNNNEVSSASLQKVTLTSITGSRVTMADIEASEVYLMGKGVDFYSIVTNSQFTVTEAAVEGGKVFNEVRFESDIFDGMTLANDGATATLSVSNELNWGEFALNNEKSNVTIMLTGFTLEGYTTGEGW